MAPKWRHLDESQCKRHPGPISPLTVQAPNSASTAIKARPRGPTASHRGNPKRPFATTTRSRPTQSRDTKHNQSDRSPKAPSGARTRHPIYFNCPSEPTSLSAIRVSQREAGIEAGPTRMNLSTEGGDTLNSIEVPRKTSGTLVTVQPCSETGISIAPCLR